MLKKLNYKKISIILVIGTLMFTTYYYFFLSNTSTSQSESINLTTTTLKLSSLEETVLASGWIVSRDSVNITTVLNTKVNKLNVQVGDLVEKGTILAVLDTQELSDDIAIAQVAYDNAKYLYNQKLDDAWEKLDDAKRLYSGGYTEGTTEWQYVYDDAVNWDAATQLAQTNYDSIRYNDTTTNAKTQLDNLLESRQDAIIKAPISGVITTVNASLGNTASGLIFTIQNPDVFNVSASIPGYDVTKLSLELPVSIEVKDVDVLLDGTLSMISPIANSSGDYDLIARIEGDISQVRLGMEATIEVILQSKDNIFVVPVDTIIEETGKFYVIQYDFENESSTRIEVTLGMETDYYVEIISSQLSEGLEILNDPLNLNVVSETAIPLPPSPFGGN